jgi:chromosomal replication initiator protein
MILLSRNEINIENSEKKGIPSNENWSIVKEKIISFYGEVVFRSWFRSVNFLRYDCGNIILTVSSRFVRDWIKTNYLNFILKSWREIDKRVINIDLIVGEENKSNFENKQQSSFADKNVQKDVSFYNIIIDTKSNNVDKNDKALAVRKNYSFEDIVENFSDFADDFSNKKSKKTKSTEKKIEKKNTFQENLSLISEKNFIQNDDENHNEIHSKIETSLIENKKSPLVFSSETIEKNLYFDERFTFDNFVKDKSNELAFFASQAFAENKKIFNSNQNPLFLYGGVGLGKTHLIHAIANHKIQNLRAQFPYDWEKKAREKIIYSSSERFMREFLSALRNRDTKSFKDKFKNVDILMIDDIQFLNGKGCTQEEFFHIFLNLMVSGKQLVISADRIPSALIGMEERLKSRLSCGIVADIRQGDYNFRLNVLKKKAYSMNNNFTNNVLEFLARNINNSIRELEGALNKLIMMKNLNSSRVIDVPFVKETLSDMISNQNHSINSIDLYSDKKKHHINYNNNKVIEIDNSKKNKSNRSQCDLSKDEILNDESDLIHQIQLKIASFYDVSMKDLLSNGRVKKIILPKQIAMFLARKMTDESLCEIAKKFGGKDHTTIIHNYKKIEKMIQENCNFAEEINQLISSIGE